MEALIVGLRVLVDQGNIKIERDAIVQTVRMGLDGSFRFN